MPTYRPRFIKQVTRAWAGQFPFIQPARKVVIPFRPVSGSFTINVSKSRFGKFTQLHFFFSPKRPPEFTIEIFLSEAEEVPPTGMRSCWREDIAVGKSGVYRIGAFMAVQHGDHWWALDRPASPSGAEPSEMWRPESFHLPFETIADLAIGHINRTLRECVFPVILHENYYD